jgi:very-short-patch-repair endonuclease
MPVATGEKRKVDKPKLFYKTLDGTIHESLSKIKNQPYGIDRKDWEGSELEINFNAAFLKAVPEAKSELFREWRFMPSATYKFDFALPRFLTAIEAEGGIYSRTPGRHTTGAGYEADAKKYNYAATLGWVVIRLGPNMIGKDWENSLTMIMTVLKARGFPNEPYIAGDAEKRVYREALQEIYMFSEPKTLPYRTAQRALSQFSRWTNQ